MYGPVDRDVEFALREWFRSVDQDGSGSIDSEELRAALDAAGERFSPVSIKNMIKLFDDNENSTIDFQEFSCLFRFIQSLRAAFERQDHDRDQLLDERQVQVALANSNLHLSQASTTRLLVQRFDQRDFGFVTFENFVELSSFLLLWVSGALLLGSTFASY